LVGERESELLFPFLPLELETIEVAATVDWKLNLPKSIGIKV